MKVLIADKFEKVGIDGLEELGCTVVSQPDVKAEELPELVKRTDPNILVVRGKKVSAETLRAGTALTLVIRAGAGIDTIDVNTASSLGVFVSNCPGKNSIAVAELVLGLLLACDRRIPDQAADLRQGSWNKSEYSRARGLYGRRLGIVGLGQIGREVAARAQAFSEKVRDVSEVLVELGEPRATRHPVKARVVYHDACHLAHAQGVRAQPRALLAAIPGIELVSPAEAEICCGSAGIYNLVQPEPAAQLGERKARHIAALNPDIIATGNPGCILQIAAAGRRLGHDWTIVHPIELLDRSIKGE